MLHKTPWRTPQPYLSACAVWHPAVLCTTPAHPEEIVFAVGHRCKLCQICHGLSTRMVKPWHRLPRDRPISFLVSSDSFVVLKKKRELLFSPFDCCCTILIFLDYARFRGSWNPNTDLWIRLVEWKNKGEAIVAMEKVTTLP